MFISLHSILGWASFCMNYCINAVWHGGDQPVALLRCNRSPDWFAFKSSALLGLVSLIFLLTIPRRFSMEFRSSALLGLVSGVSHLPLDNTPYILYGVQVRRVCWPIKHSNTIVIEPAFGTFVSVNRYQVLLENEISISIKLVSRRNHEML